MVKLYTTKSCPYCMAEEAFLKERNIEFEEINVGENQAAAREMIEKSGQTGVPVTEIDGEIAAGFDKGQLKKFLKIKE